MFPAILAALGKAKMANAASGLLGGDAAPQSPQNGGLLSSDLYDAPQGDAMQRRQALIDKRLAGQAMPMQPSETIGMSGPGQAQNQDQLLSKPLPDTSGVGQISNGLGSAIAGMQNRPAISGMMQKGMSFLKGPAPAIAQSELPQIQSQPIQRGRYQRMYPTPRV